MPGREQPSATRRQFLQGTGAAAVALSLAGPGAALSAPVARRAARPPGFALGFTSLLEETRISDLPVEGRMPRWLAGTLLRNGPALFEVGDKFNHWFDGLAMLHAFSFERGRVAYGNRFLRSSAYNAWKREGRIRYSEFATDPCRRIFSGVSTLPVLGKVPNANVSIERLGRGFRALTEIPVPVRFDPATLRTLGIAGDLLPGRLAPRILITTRRRASGSATRSTWSRRAGCESCRPGATGAASSPGSRMTRPDTCIRSR